MPTLISTLSIVYIKDILHIDEQHIPLFHELLDQVRTRYIQLLSERTEIDDNNAFFAIGRDNWIQYTENKNEQTIMEQIIGEDIIWFKGFLKNITYYNKRFLIPKE